MTLSTGDKAPAFSGATDDGATISLKDFKGQKLVIYFYPRDNTPGCTIEAQGFEAKLSAFKKAGSAVVGVSRDTIKSHEKFRAKHDLTFPLISDEDGSVCEAFGVWQEKKNYGKTYMGIVRSTFLIDEKGKIAEIWSNVRVKNHVEAVLEATQSL